MTLTQTQIREYDSRAIAFAATADQRAALDEFLAAQGLTADGIGTRVERRSRFYPAEDYHRKYKLRSVSSFVDAFEAAGYGDEELRESPIAAKLNGHAAGHDVAVAEGLSASDRGTA